MPDIEKLVRDAAASPTRHPDAGRLWRRARRRRTARLVVASVAAIVVLVGIVVGGSALVDRPAVPTVLGGESPTPSPSADPISVRVTVEAVDRTWIRASSDGQQGRGQVLPAGETRTFTGRERVTIRTGNAGGTRLVLNGRDLGVYGARGEVDEIVCTPDGCDSVVDEDGAAVSGPGGEPYPPEAMPDYKLPKRDPVRVPGFDPDNTDGSRSSADPPREICAWTARIAKQYKRGTQNFRAAQQTDKWRGYDETDLRRNAVMGALMRNGWSYGHVTLFCAQESCPESIDWVRGEYRRPDPRPEQGPWPCDKGDVM